MSRKGEYAATTLETWPREAYIPSLVRVVDCKEQQLFSIPLDFLLKGEADTLSASYLKRVVRAVVEIPTDNVDLRKDNIVVEEADAICEGTYILVETATRWRHGPQGKSRSRLFQDTDDGSTVSHSSRNSTSQNKFKLALVGRDGQCLLSEEDDTEELVACHIVPYSLGQDYIDQIVGLQNLVRLSGPANGLTLISSFHHKFDRFKWSIYEHRGRYFIHAFHGDMVMFHGKEVEFRSKKRHRLPDPKLLAWHYDQCVMTRFRGFAWRA